MNTKPNRLELPAVNKKELEHFKKLARDLIEGMAGFTDPYMCDCRSDLTAELQSQIEHGERE